jgi:hypothetical protein
MSLSVRSGRRGPGARAARGKAGDHGQGQPRFSQPKAGHERVSGMIKHYRVMCAEVWKNGDEAGRRVHACLQRATLATRGESGGQPILREGNTHGGECDPLRHEHDTFRIQQGHLRCARKPSP